MGELDKIITNLPPLAAIAFGATFAIVVMVARLGIVAGLRSGPAAAPAAQVAAVIVDPSALNRASNELHRHTAAVRDLVEVGQDLAKTMSHMAIELNRIREELRIQRELARRT